MAKLKAYSLSEMEDKYIGTKGTKGRDEYEYELRMDLLGRMIKQYSVKVSSGSSAI